MERIFILGAGGQAKEIAWLIKDINRKDPTYQIEGFIDVNPSAKSISIGKITYPVVEEKVFLESTAREDKSIHLAIGTGSPAITAKLAAKFKGFHFPNLIHPSFLADFDSIGFGEGNIVAAGCVFSTCIKAGSFNLFNYNMSMGHDCVIGNNNVFNPGCTISGGVQVGNGNLFGANCTVLQYLSCGDNSILGAAALLTKNLESNKTAVGIPARVVKENI